jgi:hypothetical protein
VSEGFEPVLDERSRLAADLSPHGALPEALVRLLLAVIGLGPVGRGPLAPGSPESRVMSRHRLALLALALPLAATTLAPAPRAQAAPLPAAVDDFAVPWIGYDTSAYPQGHLPSAARSGDFNGDGITDLAVVTWHANSRLELLYGLGDGRYAPPVLLTLPLGSLDLAPGDFDGDGDLDIAVSNTGQVWEGTSISLFRNLGGGSFAAPQFYASGAGPTGLVAADLDNDGDLDLATAHDKYIVSANTIATLLNNGNGTFASPKILTLQGGTYEITAGDLNGDGRQDLVVAHENDRISVLLNGPLGFAAATVYQTPGSSYSSPTATLADVEEDGDLDVLYSGSEFFLSPRRIALFRNTGSGALAPFETLAMPAGVPGAVDIEVADVTGDGWLDILGAGEIGQAWTLFRGNGAGGFLGALAFRATENPVAVEAPDLDADGDRDVVVVGRNSLEAAVYLNPGNGAFWQPPYVAMSDTALAPSSYSRLATGDVDGDGDLDAAVGWRENFGTQKGLRLALNAGDGSFALVNLAVPELPADVLMLDIDADGDLDLVLADEEYPYALRWKLNDGKGGFGATLGNVGVPCGPGDISSADLDGDARPDILWAGESGCFDAVHVSFNTGAGFGPASAVHLSDFATVVDAADLDGDGDADLVTNSGTQGWLEISLGNGDGSFAPPFLAVADIGVRGLAIADYDGDGILDIATTNGVAGDTLAVLIGYGDGGFKAPKIYAGGFSSVWDNVNDIDAADADGDADIDLFVGNYGSQDVSFWRNTGAGSFQPQVRLGVGQKVFEAQVADFTGDGAADLLALVEPVAANTWYFPGLVLFEGSGEGTAWVDLGSGLAGSFGVPSLAGSGELQAGSSVTLSLTGAAPSSNAGFVVGPTRADLPFKGGVLVPSPALIVPAVTSAAGTFTLAAVVPVTLPSGFELYVQAWIADAAGPSGFAASNALGGQTP